MIGQANGFLMNHFRVDAPRAFAMLQTVSQNDNTPLQIVARRIIEKF